MKKRLISLVLALVVVLSLVPTVALAGEHDGQVRVIVENTTYAKSEGAPWEGTLVDEWVNITDDSTMMSCVVEALSAKDYTQEGAESNYITEINGLSQYDGGSMSGWMGTLNDWFTDTGFGDVSVEKGTLADGDEIRIMYTCDWGADCGNDWSSTDKTVKGIVFSAGTLDKAFDKDTHAYTLTVPADTAAVTVTPTASNKNFQVHTYVGSTEYKRTAAVPVTEGTVITVKCGETETYTFTVAYAQPVTEKPSFDSLNFVSMQLVSGSWTTTTYQKDTYAYALTLKDATVGLSLQNTTKYDTSKYTAAATYQTAAGETATIPVKNAALTAIAGAADLPFGQSTVTISIAAISDPTNKTDYVFTVTRPRNETKTVKNSGIVLQPVGRNLSAQLYQGQAEGTMFKADAAGTLTSGNGVSGTQYNYRAYVWDKLSQFTLSFTGSSAYNHLRYSTNNGTTWSDAVQESGITAPISFPNTVERNPTVKVMIQVLDDKTYVEKGFDAASANTYTVWVERVTANAEDALILTAETQSGDWYPAFTSKQNSFVIVVPNGTKTMDMVFTVSDGATVKVGTKEATATEGKYTITLTTNAQKINVTSADGSLTNTYSFKLQARSAKAYADKVVDYLPINSQYTNAATAMNPEKTLAGTMVSLGNWGGYITYYFDKPLTDDPNNKYGMDFYAYGNAFASGGSAAENGQVWVSEDGKTWYALAGSEHYEDDVLWDYQVTYSKTAAGKTAWADNQGNSNDGTSQSGKWVDPNVYYLNDLAKNDTITLQGIVMYSQGGTIRGDSSTGENSYVHAAKFGYVDYFGNGTVGADVNPYIQTPVNANGFDLAWAVDAQGNAVDVSQMKFHYVKVVTASNIWAGTFNEKSTETQGVLRTTAQDTAVGKTNMPVIKVNGKKVTDFSKAVAVNETFSVTVDAPDGANVYINNQWGSSREFTAIPAHGMIRVIAQEGDKEPYIAVFSVSVDPTPVIERARDIHTAVGDSLLENAEKSTPTVGSIGGEWLMLGLARSGKLTDAVNTAAYYRSVVDYVTAAAGKRDTNPSTDYSRMILALTAMDKDPTNVGGHDLTAKLGSMSYLNKQGTNGPVWALIALDSHNYAVSGDVTQKKLIDTICSAQMESGGWYISDTDPVEDVDMTAMAVQALAPYYYENNSKARDAVDKALAFLSKNQGENGDFGTSESDAQVVVALCALGRDPASDAHFIKGWNSVLSAMCSYYADGASKKGFKHTKDGDYNQMATEQCYYALVAYDRFKSDKTALYDMSDVHQMTKTAAKAATCTAEGNNEYWFCSRCNKYFKDEAGTTVTTVAAETLTKLGHDFTEKLADDAHRKSAATCKSAAIYYYDCSRCSEVSTTDTFVYGSTVPHSYGTDGKCIYCDAVNPMKDVDTQSIATATNVGGKPVSGDNVGKIVANDDGLVIKTETAADPQTVEEIKKAVEANNTVVTIDEKINTTITATEADKTGITAVEALKEISGVTNEQKDELDKIVVELESYNQNAAKKNVKVEQVVDVSLELLKVGTNTSLGEIKELEQPVEVRIPAGASLQGALTNSNKIVKAIISHTAADGSVTTFEADVDYDPVNKVAVIKMDAFSTVAFVTYDKVGGGHHGGTVTPVSVKSAPTGDAGVVLYIAMCAMSCIGSTALLCKRKEEA